MLPLPELIRQKGSFPRRCVNVVGRRQEMALMQQLILILQMNILAVFFISFFDPTLTRRLKSSGQNPESLRFFGRLLV